jgi:hypothetical protein
MFPVLRENLVRMLGGNSSDRMACNIGHRLLSTGDKNKCLSYGRDYVKKQWDSDTTKSELFLLQPKIKNPEYIHCKFTA